SDITDPEIVAYTRNMRVGYFPKVSQTHPCGCYLDSFWGLSGFGPGMGCENSRFLMNISTNYGTSPPRRVKVHPGHSSEQRPRTGLCLTSSPSLPLDRRRILFPALCSCLSSFSVLHRRGKASCRV